jgi:hypothetical protein
MFKRQIDYPLPKHVECSKYIRKDKNLSPTDRIALEKFYKSHNLKHYDLPTQEPCIYFKRTINFVYITAKVFCKDANGKRDVLRTKAFVFYRGIILYTLDHDKCKYPYGNHTLTNQKKCIKLNYGTHEELNNEYLKEMGRYCEDFVKFNSACLNLLIHDNEQQSINFIKEA